MKERMRQSSTAKVNKKNGAPEYLYHLQKSDSAPTGKIPRRENPREPHVSSHTGLHTFLLVLASMGLFLLVVLFISKKTWQMKESARTRDIHSGGAVTEQAVDLGKKRLETEELLAGVTRSDSDLTNEATLLARRGDLLQAAGQALQAAEMYAEALKIWPDLNSVRGELGRLHLRQRAYGKALIVLQAAVGNEPDSPALLNDLAVAFFYQNRIPKALELLDAVIQYDPNFAPAHFNRALCFLIQSDQAAAREALDRYLVLAPGDAKALKEKAFLEASQQRYPEAYAIQLSALNKTPDWVPLVLDAAAVSALMGEPERAWSHLEHAAAKAPPAVVLRSFRGSAFEAIRKTEAGQAFEKRLDEQARRGQSLDEHSRAWDAFSNEPLLFSPPAGSTARREKPE